ncbi:unnamed protein product, partial [Meganyctiphanes norvegica]
MQGTQLFLLFLTLYGASAQVTDWGLDDGLLMEMQEQFGNPLKHALQGISVLMDYRGPAIDAIPQRDKETSNDTLDLSTEESEALRYYLPSAKSNISEKCRHDVLEFQKAFKMQVFTAKKPRLWSILMVDSWGKLPDGYISGNSMPLGMMEECTNINVDDHEVIGEVIPVRFNATFKGQYCFVVHGLPWDEVMAQGQAGIGSPVISGNIYNYMYYGSSYGTCMPDSCTKDDFKVSLEEILPAGHAAKEVDCHTKDEELTWKPKEYLFMGVMGFIAFLVVVAAAVDLTINYMDTQELRKGPLRYLLVFSGYTNMSKIFHINTKPPQGNIGCLHGIRVLTFTWVLICHQYSVMIYAIENGANMANMFDDILAQTILSATPSVDTFFFLSGLLVAYGLMRGKDKMDLYGFFMFYVHRFIRLAPPIAAVGFFSATVARLLFSGPLGDVFSRYLVPICEDNWWYDVLFINNFVNKSCIGQTWYTSVDMQMYVMLPIMFFPLMYYEKIGSIWLSFMTVVSFAIPTMLTHVYQIPLGTFTPQDKAEDYMFFLYNGPWSRLSPYLIGLFTGYIIYKTANKKVTMTMWQVILGWVLSVGIGLLVVYGEYPYNNLNENYTQDRVPTQPISDVYNGFFRGAWGLALMWLLLACHFGYGGLVNSFLAHPSWQPMSRLTYGMFLVSITIQFIIVGSQYTSLYYDHLTVIIFTCGTLFMCGIGSCILSLLVEGPVLGLEKLLFARQDKKKKVIPINEEEEYKTPDILNVEAPAEEK